ncbi:MAG: DUF1598 domain-containing protein [Pirellulales bacterium]
MRLVPRAIVAAFVLCTWLSTVPQADAGISGGSVGGVRVDLDGVLANVDAGELARLRKAREEALAQIPGDLNRPAKLRKVSLRWLGEAIRNHLEKQPGMPLPDEIEYLAGLQRIQYIFVYPERKDVVLAGPADGWKVNEQAEVVGATSGLPVLKFDDFLVALSAISGSPEATISCSIDPTPDGIKRLNAFLRKQRGFNDAVKEGIVSSLGKQTVTLRGVASTTHFGHVLVAADYRMKRYAMDIENPPVSGMPSYLDLMKSARANPSASLTPRWWIEPDYKPLLTDDKGFSWELRPGIKVMSEDEQRGEDGAVRGSGKTNPLAKKWADTMTARYNDLAAKDTIFTDLRNCIDLSVAAALLVKEKLAEKAGLDLSTFADGKTVMTNSWPTPKHIATEVSAFPKGREWVITASGGVQFSALELASKRETTDSIGPARTAAEATGKNWWWD